MTAIHAKKEVATLEEFWPRFLDGMCERIDRNPVGLRRQSPFRKWHLIPLLGPKRLDAITNEHVQKLKLSLLQRKPKTVNNVLTVLNTVLKKAVEWGELDKLPCTIKLLPNPKKSMGLHDFAEYERLLTVAKKRGP